jgi:hypothetical protein
VREDAGLEKELAQAIVCHDQPRSRRDTMAITLHHLIIPAKDKLASAQLFAEIFGLTVKPSEGRFAWVPLDEHLTIDFADDEHTRGILPVSLGFFEFVHNARKRGKALLPALIELLVT